METLLHFERNGKIKFLSNRAQFRLETESWNVLKRQVVATDRTDDLLSVTSDPPTKSTYFHLGTVWHQVTKTNSRECLEDFLAILLSRRMMCVVNVKSKIQQMNEKIAPFKRYNHAPLGQISGCIKIYRKDLKNLYLMM